MVPFLAGNGIWAISGESYKSKIKAEQQKKRAVNYRILITFADLQVATVKVVAQATNPPGFVRHYH
jgi:hypothetical protein